MNDDDFLRADAERWNAHQPPPPSLDDALDRLTEPVGVERSRRNVLSILSAAAVVAAAAAVVVIGASTGGARQGTSAGSIGDAVTHHVDVTITRTHIVDVTHPRSSGALETVTEAITNTAHETMPNSTVTSSAITTQLRTIEVTQTTATPVFGRLRALLVSLGMFVVIAGAWGLGRNQRRRTH